MKNLLLSGLFCCVLVWADFNAPSWRYRRPLSVEHAAAVAEFTVDPALYRDSAANLDDLRILRDGKETPYVIETLAGSRETVEPPATMLNKGWAQGVGVEAVLDLKRHTEHNRLRIGTALHNYKERVRIETSDDAHNWAMVQADGLIFDVLREDHAVSENTISYPTSTRRYLRVTIPGWTNAANLENVWLSEFKETDATRNEVANVMPTVREDAKAQTTELTVDLGFAGQPYDHIDLTIDPGLFIRTVEIATTNDPQRWDTTTGGVILRTAEEEQLELEIPERTERYVKITVFNADSAPLHFSRVALSGIRRVVKFASGQAGQYSVYFGNSNARQPSYDFARILPGTAVVPAAAKLGDTQANPAFRLPERPWTDRNPWLLNCVLAVAVVAMGFVTLRMMRKVS